MPFARNGGVRLYYEVDGDPEGEPVLLIFGMGGSSRAWYRLLPRVIEQGYRAIVMDNRGTGRSSAIRSPFAMGDMVDDALAVLDETGHVSAHVLGASMGGMIAQHIALDHRERVRSLILLCTAPLAREGLPPPQLLANTLLSPILGATRTWPLMASILYSRRTRRSRPERVEQDREILEAEGMPTLTTLGQLLAVVRHDTRRRLAELDGIPTTVIHGEEDALVPPDRGRRLAHAIPGAGLVLLPDAGHLFLTDAEEPAVEAILHHLEAASGSASDAPHAAHG